MTLYDNYIKKIKENVKNAKSQKRQITEIFFVCPHCEKEHIICRLEIGKVTKCIYCNNFVYIS